ncbi:MAG: ligand-gated channel protein [Hyphomicrobium sp. 32-62-53]|nr:MAG: ligand-gated channel protein [Hyphomicrobium sp. 12-62-95]OYX99668.1 MAG: ligand-gated channel protein [Hyphomicrobium sp. 32-62-53]
MSINIPRRLGAFMPTAALSFTIIAITAPAAFTQNAAQGELPPVEVQQPNAAAKPKASKAKPKPKPATAAKPQAEPEPVAAADVAPDASAAPAGDADPKNPYAIVAPGTRSGSLGVPTAAEARAEINRTPGGVDVVPAEEYKDNTPAITLKDALDYVPGVFIQPKWGEDSRLSIRGSGLSRNFHGRGVTLLMDGVIPITTADGSSDFQEIDPTAYRYIEVFKGGNALQYGANSLGGAINFVMPTGYDSDLFGARVDVGSFGLIKTSVSSGAVSGNTDYFITGTWQEADGFRDHSEGESFRGSANVGFKITPDLETRFYVNANQIRQDIPGAVTRANALSNPEGANPGNVARDFERNLDTVRVANRTAWRVQDGTVIEFGGFYMDRHLDHPIFRVIDNKHNEYGGFWRIVDDNVYGGFRNRFVAGVGIHNGETRARQFLNVLGERGTLFSDAEQKSDNTTFYAENSFFISPTFAIVGGVQYNDVEREQQRIAGAAAVGQANFDFWSPKGGFIWEPAKEWQIFGNISRSGEAPTFSEVTLAGAATTSLKVQRATTYEIGTRGNTPDFRWDLALYRSNIDNEFQCRTNLGPGGVVLADGTCTQINLDKSVHQGVELGGAARVFMGVFEPGPRADEIWLHGAYTFNDFRFDNDARWGDNELPGAPRHYLRAELLYKHPSGVYAGPNVEWSPEAFFVDSANTVETTSYALLGAKLGFDNGGQWSAYIEGRNLTDEAYIASASIATIANANSLLFEPGTGRAVYGGIQFRW